MISKTDLSVLLDLKHLLIEAGQQLPAFIKQVAGEDEEVANLEDELGQDEMDKGCSYCSGLGHRITNCPKLESVRTKVGEGVDTSDSHNQNFLNLTSHWGIGAVC